MPGMLRSCTVAHPSSLVVGDADLILNPMFFEMAAVDAFNALAPGFNTTLLSRGIHAVFKVSIYISIYVIIVIYKHTIDLSQYYPWLRGFRHHKSGTESNCNAR